MLVVVMGMGGARGARASEAPPAVRACIAAYERGQQLERAGKLSAARRMLTDCAVDVCPVELRADCSRWLGELAPRVPSIVVAARTASGQDVPDERLFIDGREAADRLDGLPVEIDPGIHLLRLESGKEPPVLQRILVREGEQLRKVDLVLPAPLPPRRPVPWPTYVLAGAGVVASATFGYFAISGNSGLGDLDSCKGFCTQSSVDSVNQRFVVANISLGIAITAFGAAAIVLLTRPSRPVSSPAAAGLTSFAF